MAYAVDRITPLKQEHKEITRQLSLVRRLIAESPHTSSGNLRRSVDRLASAVEMHFVEEESSLYAPLRTRLGAANPVDAMAREHRAIRRILGQISTSMERKAPRDGAGDMRSRFDSLQRELGGHIEKEEMVLFWLADLKL